MAKRSKLGLFCKTLVPLFGRQIVDCRSGEVLGRAFLVSWFGRFYVLGYNGKKPLQLVWLAEDKVRYWRSRVGFTTYTESEVTVGLKDE